jgi:PAS domain S-box-containing protein
MNNQTESGLNIPNILVVDDVPANLKLLADILKSEGYKTRPVPAGELALRAAEKERPDLILLDVMMPGIDGFEVCRRLKEHPGLKEIPVIFISALGETDDIVKALALGGVDYITKPFQAEEVKARVKTHLKLRSLNEELKVFSQAVEQSPLNIIITNLNGTIEYANPKACELTGYSFKELIGHNPRMLKSGETTFSEYELLWKTIRSGNVWKGVFHNKKKNGELFWESAAICPVIGENGEVIRYLAVKEDITERRIAEKKIHDLNTTLEIKVKERTRELSEANKLLEVSILELKRAEEEITKSRDEAMKANLAKSEFLSRVSHELRTPLNAILGFAQLLDMGDLNPKQKKSNNHILTSGRYLLDLIDEVLDISSTETGKLTLSAEPIKLNPFIHELIDSIRPQVLERQIILEFINQTGDQFVVETDNKLLKQVLLNLLSNAIKYNITGGSVIVKTELLPASSNDFASFRISITNTGEAISPENMQKLFEPFERIGAEKTETKGSGLGLTVVKKFTVAMGGKVGVASKPGEGNTFWIELPLTVNQTKCSVQNQ